MKRLNLSYLQKIVAELLIKYQGKHGLSQQELADIIGIQRSHLNALINGGRTLTGYYLHFMISRGVISLTQIQEHINDEMSEREKQYWAEIEIVDNHALIAKLAKLKKVGFDIEGYIDGILSVTKK